MKFKKLLIFVPFYLPGSKAGGPIKSVTNIINEISSDISVYLVTRNHDYNERATYDLAYNRWLQRGNSYVYYVQSKYNFIFHLIQLVRDLKPNLIYLNSFFEPKYSILIVFLRIIGAIKVDKLIIAPRGELYPGALKLHKTKFRSFLKPFYLKLASLLNIYRNVHWHSTSIEETEQIIKIFKSVSRHRIIQAENISYMKQFHSSKAIERMNEEIKIIFLSRIVKKKNLYYALQVLMATTVSIDFDIYGPIEDEAYWQECLDLVKKMPNNVSIKYQGIVKPDEIDSIFKKYDLLFLPTLGENYGHVIFEALLNNTKVLISDQTPWRNLEIDGIGWDIPLYEFDRFVEIIQSFEILDNDFNEQVLQLFREGLTKRINTEKNIELTRKIFE